MSQPLLTAEEMRVADRLAIKGGDPFPEFGGSRRVCRCGWCYSCINQRKLPCVVVDIPSGCDGDTEDVPSMAQSVT